MNYITIAENSQCFFVKYSEAQRLRKGGKGMLYQNIKAIADSKKISISEIERQCEITPRYICSWDKRMPRLDTLTKVANCLGVTIDVLVNGTDNPKAKFNQPTQKE